MSFPNFTGKHAHDAFFTPQEFVAYLRREGRLPDDLVLPAGIILSYHPRMLLSALAEQEVEEIPIAGYRLTLLGAERAVGLCKGFGIGAPAVVGVVELLIALGARAFVSIGTAGALAPAAHIGDLVVCDRAIRDEGVSHHYLASEKYAYPAATLTQRLAERLRARGQEPHLGLSWTIDAPYRETVEEARQYQQEGALTVEMEASALFAVAQLRGVEMAAGFVISDSLADLVWNPQFNAEATAAGFIQLFHAAREALTPEASQTPS
jgi:uridine phosphorylase